MYPTDVRTQVMGALLQGQGVTETAAQYNLPTSTVSRWRQRALEEMGACDTIGDLLLAYLRESLETLAAQVEAFRDPEWLRKQSASEVGVLHGILTDKAVRLLEALQAGSGFAPPAGREVHRA